MMPRNQISDEENKIRDLVRGISESISRLREIVIDPVSISLTDVLDFEVMPIGDDDRITIGRKGWGCTIVNYTHEGLILDVLPENEIDSVHTAALMSDELVGADCENTQNSLEFISRP